MWGNWCGTGILHVAIGPDTDWKPVPHQMPHISHDVFPLGMIARRR